MDDLLVKEIKITNQIISQSYVELEKDKKEFAELVKSEIGPSIKEDLSKPLLKIKKPNFWTRLINVFK